MQRTATTLRDVPGQGGMRLGGVELLRDDAGGVGIETEEPRLQAGCDKPFVEAERKVIVVVGHPGTRPRLLEGDRRDNNLRRRRRSGLR